MHVHDIRAVGRKSGLLLMVHGGGFWKAGLRFSEARVIVLRYPRLLGSDNLHALSSTKIIWFPIFSLFLVSEVKLSSCVVRLQRWHPGGAGIAKVGSTRRFQVTASTDLS